MQRGLGASSARSANATAGQSVEAATDKSEGCGSDISEDCGSIQRIQMSVASALAASSFTWASPPGSRFCSSPTHSAMSMAAISVTVQATRVVQVGSTTASVEYALALT